MKTVQQMKVVRKEYHLYGQDILEFLKWKGLNVDGFKVHVHVDDECFSDTIPLQWRDEPLYADGMDEKAWLVVKTEESLEEEKI